MKTRKNIWPFGTNQPLGPRVSYGKRRIAELERPSRRPAAGGGGRRVSAAAAAKLDRESAAERRERTISAPDFERKLKAHYAKGGNLNEFLQANPAAANSEAFNSWLANFLANASANAQSDRKSVV